MSSLPRFLLPAFFITLPLLAACEAPLFYADKSVTLPHVASRALAVDAQNGGVTVSGGRPAQGADAEVQIRAHIGARSEDRLAAAAISAQRMPDGSLRVSMDWPDGRQMGNESATFVISLPDTSAVTIVSSNGGIAISELAGPADLRTSNGSVTVSAHEGPVKAHTSNGEVTVHDARSEVAARTSNGHITVSLADANTAPVDLRTSNGSITLKLNRSWTGVIDPRTSNGRVSVLGKAGKGEVTVGAGGAKSTLETSNGNITVEFNGDQPAK